MNKAERGKVKGFLTVKNPDGTFKARIPFEGAFHGTASSPPSSQSQSPDSKEQQVK